MFKFDFRRRSNVSLFLQGLEKSQINVWGLRLSDKNAMSVAHKPCERHLATFM